MYFGKHQTFHVRDGWLYKGMTIIQERPTIFLDDDAPEELGLGKNMVEALRYWMQATGIAYEDYLDGRKAQFLTPLGELIREHDPYQELDGTLWLLHHALVCSRELATAWYWFFNHYIPDRFERETFVERLDQWINLQEDTDKSYSPNTLKRDFDCLVRTYAASDRDSSPEDLLESPLSSLGLLSSFVERDARTGKKYRVHRLEPGDPDTIPPLVFLYVLLSRQEVERKNNRQVPIQTVLREARNAGRTFNISVTKLEEILSDLADRYPEWRVHLTRTGGLDQMTLPDVPSKVVLQAFYESQQTTERVAIWSQQLS